MGQRFSYSDSCNRLRQLNSFKRVTPPPIPDQMPHVHDPGPHGIRFEQAMVCDVDLADLCLPRTFIQHSAFANTCFRNTDLSHSNLCWNEFRTVDFSDADLSGCDLRGSIFMSVSFIRTDLRGADLRRSIYRDCDFSEARMEGVKLSDSQMDTTGLSPDQIETINWQVEDGDYPEGD